MKINLPENYKEQFRRVGKLGLNQVRSFFQFTVQLTKKAAHFISQFRLPEGLSNRWREADYWRSLVTKVKPLGKSIVQAFRYGIFHQLPKLWDRLKKIEVSSLLAGMKDITSRSFIQFEKIRVKTLQYLRKQEKILAHKLAQLSKRGLQFGGLLGLIGTLITLASVVYYGDRSEKDAIRLAQNSMESSNRVLGAHFKYKIQGFKEIVRMFAASQVEGLTAGSVDPMASYFNSVPEVLDVSIWALKENESVLEVGPQYGKIRMFANRNAPEMSLDLFQQLIHSELIEKKEIPALSQLSETLQVVPQSLQLGQGIVLLSLKIPHPQFQLIAVAHLQLKSLYSAFHDHGLSFAAFTDDHGKVILESSSALAQSGLAPSQLITPLIEVMSTRAQNRNQIEFQDPQGREYLGSYEKLGVGRSAVVSILPVEAVIQGFSLFTPRSILLLILSFMIYFAYGYSMFSQSTQLAPELSPQDEKRLAPQKTTVSVLHGSLRQLFYILEIESPEQAKETLNEFFTLAAQVIRKNGGLFERVSGRSFMGVWGVPESITNGSRVAVETALALRRAYFGLDEARRVDGQKPFAYTLGVHEGEVLAAHLGPSGELQYSVAGDVIQQAATLEGVALSQKKDLLISDAICKHLEGQFQTKALGEVKLTAVSGLVQFHEVLAQLSPEGQWMEVPVHPSAVQDSSPVGAILETHSIEVLTQPQREPRWVVNNGNQIIGPFSPSEVSRLLFAQELDFDCECWEETSGQAAQIKDSGMFSGAGEDQTAHLWMYDGESIHGPISLGFIQIARSHASLSSQIWICDSSTINGWKTMDEFLVSQANSPSHSVNDPVSSPETLSPEAPSPPQIEGIPPLDSPLVLEFPQEAVPDASKVSLEQDAEQDSQKKAA